MEESHWFAVYLPLPNEAVAERRIRAFERSLACRVLDEACSDWADAFNACPTLLQVWFLDEQENDTMMLGWEDASTRGAGLPAGVSSSAALLALSALCYSRLRTAGVTVEVKQVDDPDDLENVAYMFTIRRRRRGVGKAGPAKGVDRE